MKRKWYRNRNLLKNMGLFAAGILVLLSAFGAIWVASFRIPDFNSFENRKVVNSTQIFDRTGEVLLYDIHRDIRRTNVPFEKMSANIKNATVAIEDSEFYNHGGIRITSIMRAVLSNILGLGRTQGGSTITQQLVKNTLLTSKKTYSRKIKEWFLAMKIDNSMPKEKILEYYLNENPYGGNIYGIEEAARTYFKKSAEDLSIAEAAYLAAIPQSPTALSPYGRNPDRLESRKNLVLSRMLDLKFISREEYNRAKAEIVVFAPEQKTGIKAPHFVFFIKDYLERKYGEEKVAEGLKVTTTLDYSLQERAEQIVKEGALRNEKDWNGENAGLVAIDPKTGQIITMVGSRDYFDKEIDGNYNVATALRQPGSSFKPFIYATAFGKGFTPDTVLFDLPTEFNPSCSPYGGDGANCYMPQNFDGKTRGPISLRNALAQSINIPAVKLLYLVGLNDAIRVAENMGISTLTNPDRYGLTLVIGGGEVTLLDMTSAYGVFAAGGVRRPYTGILKVEDRNGRALEEFSPEEKEVLPKNTALIISDILSDNASRAPTFGPASLLFLPGKDVAAKTGTTNSNRDAWTMGYSPGVVVGVWAGNNDNTPMKKGGVAMAGPIWNKFMNEALKVLPDENFEEPNLYADPEVVKPILRGFWQGNETFVIDRISGGLATAATPPETREEKALYNVHTILYWVNRKDILGPPPGNPGSDPQFAHWERGVQDWWARNSGQYSLASPPSVPDSVHVSGLRPVLNILEPNSTALYDEGQRITIKVASLGAYPIKKMDVFVNGIYLGSADANLNFSFIPGELDNLMPVNDLRLSYQDTAWNRGETLSTFRMK